MRTGASDVSSRRFRGQIRPDARLKKNRKTRLHRAFLDTEFLEPRTLLATIPAAAAVGGPQNILTGAVPAFNNAGGLTANQSSIQVVVDPHNPQKMIAAWVDNDPALLGITNNTIAVITEMAYSVNAGQTWHPLQGEPANGSGIPVSPEVLDPATSNPIVPFRYQTDPSLGFDANDNVYLLTAYHNTPDVAASGSGALVLQKYSFSGNAPVQQGFPGNLTPRSLGFGFGSGAVNILYGWNSTAFDSVTHPTMQVDSNQSVFTDSTTGQVQTDPYSGNVYVAWSGIDVKPSLADAGSFNPNRIKLIVSSDGGNNFTSEAIADVSTTQPDNGNGPTTERDVIPALTISQGRPEGESGKNGDVGTPGGQVTVVWDNFGDGQVMANTVSGGNDYAYPGAIGTIPFGTTTLYNSLVQFPANFNFNTLSNLTLTVSLVDASDANLGLTLIAPSGDSITLFVPQTVGGVTNTGVGISGANLGTVSTNGYPLGTTFDDNATRSIFDPNNNGTNANTSPYIGNYRIERRFSPGSFSSLQSFLQAQIAKGINGTWKLQATETSTSAPTTPAFFNYWALSFTGGVVPGTTGLTPNVNDVVLPGTKGLVLPGLAGSTYATASAASPVGIGPGIVVAQDNTLGGLSPYEGRIYAAFVGYYNITIAGVKNPTDNTDIFLTHSDDGGRSWSTPLQVNDDQSVADGFSESNSTITGNPIEVTGRAQFQPQIAVDQVTGTVVLSWRDGRNDAARARVATYITASIDGGQTFNAQTYANPTQTAVDAITGQTVVIGPQADNNSSGNSHNDTTYGFGSSMGLAVYDGKIYPMWSGNLNQGNVVNGAIQGSPMGVQFQPMVIAAGPRIITSSQGPIAYPAAGGTVSFTVTFDRPINPPGTTPTFTTNDVQVFYHDTTSGDPSIPLLVTNIAPVTSSGVGPGSKFGYTQFTVTFDPNKKHDGSASGITNFTGTYSYLVTPDDGNGKKIEQLIPSSVIAPVNQPVIGPVTSTDTPLVIPLSGTGGSGTPNDNTTSRIFIPGNTNQLITGITVRLTLNHQRAGDLRITFGTPDGRSTVIYQGSGNGSLNFVNVPFVVNNLNGGSAAGNYTLTINDSVSNNTGTLTNWSVTVSSELPGLVQQTGAPMDQNADATPDQNPLLVPYTGLTPGDVYAAPAPAPTSPITFTTAASILSPPFNQNTLPLIVPGPHVVSTSVPTGTGADNLITDGTTSTFHVTFDRPIKVSSFPPNQVLQIMGPTGSVSGPQYFASDSVGLTIPNAVSSTVPSSITSTLTVPSFNGTFKIAKVTVQLNAAFTNNSGLSAILIAPDDTPLNPDRITLFANNTLSGANLVNTTFDDAAVKSITAGTAPYSGTFLASGMLAGFAGKSVDGVWKLQLVNTLTGASGTLGSWSLNITPVVTVTPVSQSGGLATTFTVGFPLQRLSGTYTIQLGTGILDQFNQPIDSNQNAGLAALRGQEQNNPTTPVLYTAADTPKPIPAPLGSTAGQVSSSISVTDNFIVQGDFPSGPTSPASGMRLQLNITYPFDPDLTATLYHYDVNGNLLGSAILFSKVGSGIRTANFTSTAFDDRADTPIQNGGAPFFATFNPQQSLATAFAGMSAQGTWTLVIQNATAANGGTGATGLLTGWSLSFLKPLPTTGLGEPGSDNANGSFRIFSLGQTDALSSQAWTSVGPASIGGGGGGGGAEDSSGARSGRVGGIAIDPSDPTGNTVYVAGASGGIWKTTNFLTTNPAGPTYIPLTNFGPTSGVNIGGITVFGRNHDPNQSLIIASTGEGDTGTPGVGFLISQDGGATWNLYDSLTNVDSSGNLLPIQSTARDRTFVGTTSFKVVTDPQLTPSGQVIIYAALSGTNGGIYRSEDTGKHWQLMLAGQATDIVLDPNSGIVLNPTTHTTVQGNLQIVYAAIRGSGVFLSPNQGQVWNLMAGGVGNPLIVDTRTLNNVNPTNGLTPNGAQGRIVLAVPTPTGNAAQDAVYNGWLYATVATPAGGLFGIFVTKDFGQNWTQVRIPTLPALNASFNQAIATNDVSQGDFPIIGSSRFPQGNYNITMTVDPTNPNIIYVGGTADGNETGLIRIDLTTIWDAHSLVAYSSSAKDGGAIDLNSTAPTTHDDRTQSVNPGSFLNFIRNPLDPFLSATQFVSNYASFTNNGAGVEWIPFDAGGTDYHRVTTMIDPLTGLPRLIFGNDQGVWSILDNNGSFETQVGSSTPLAGVDRNGNLQITQFYYGAAQPSSAAAQIAGALFYGTPRITEVRHRLRIWSAVATSRGVAPAATPRGWPPTSKARVISINTGGAAAAAISPMSFRSTASDARAVCSRRAAACPPPIRSGPSPGVPTSPSIPSMARMS